MYEITFIGNEGSYTLSPIKSLTKTLKVVHGLRKAGIPCTYNPKKENNK